MMPARNGRFLARLADAAAGSARPLSVGRVLDVVGISITAGDLFLPVGALCALERPGDEDLLCEVVALREDGGERRSVLLPYGATTRIVPRALVREVTAVPTAPVGRELLGRVIDGLGRPLDERPLVVRRRRTLRPRVSHPLRRQVIDAPLATGVRAIDAFATMGRGQRIGITAGSGVGKALALDTPIPTPNGWTTMGELEAGDQVFDEKGRPCNVLFVTETMTDRPCFEVEFSDGSVIVADAEHQWLTLDYPARKNISRRVSDERLVSLKRRRLAADWGPRVRTTAEIASTLVDVHGGSNHAVPLTAPLQYPHKELPVDPYVLGAWLGDGTSSSAAITTADDEILTGITAAGYELRPRKTRSGLLYGIGSTSGRWKDSLQGRLRSLGVLKNKHIPDLYLYASVAQRMRLLAGLLDTDAECRVSGLVCFTSTNERLARGVFDLAAGLGLKPTIKTRDAKLNGVVHGTAWNVVFTTAQKVFTVERKARRQRETVRQTQMYRYITDVRPVASVPVRCIGVDSESHLYLAGRTCIPTHNSTLLGMIARDNDAHVNVVALIGERNREVQDFITSVLGEEGLRRSVVVVATSDEPALLRLRAAQLASAIAEDFRDEGLDVAFFCDSITRFANAQREIGLAAGEIPVRSGYTPSVFQALPELLERSGMGERGSITGFYTVLVEADDTVRDVVADEVRARLDGHIVLDRVLNEAGHFPPIDIVSSLSRVMPRITEDEQRADATLVRSVVAAYREKRTLIESDAYEAGTNPRVDAALKLLPSIEVFLRQRTDERTRLETTRALLRQLAEACRQLGADRTVEVA